MKTRKNWKAGVFMQMQLMILILSKVDVLSTLLTRLIAAGISGTTVVDCEGAMRVLSQADIEPPPIFAGLRQYLNPQRQKGKLVLVVLSDAQVPAARQVIHDVVGGLDKPDTGIVITLPLSSAEGLSSR
jgi:hypothetical protein